MVIVRVRISYRYTFRLVWVIFIFIYTVESTAASEVPVHIKKFATAKILFRTHVAKSHSNGLGGTCPLG